MSKLKSSCLALLRNKWFCLFWLIAGLLYVTIYGLLYVEDPFTQGLRGVNVLGVLIEPTMRATASVIGKTYPVAFHAWGIIQTISYALNILYCYRRYGFKSRAGNVLLTVAACSIVVNNCIPSTEIFGLQLVAHWGTALIFAFSIILALGLFLLHGAKTSRRMLATFIIYAGLVVSMLAMLGILGKSGGVENIPSWATYLILLLANYTGVYKNSLPEKASRGMSCCEI